MKFDDDNESGGLKSEHFIKLKDGDTVSGVFRGEIHKLRNHWLGTKSTECTGSDCKPCKDGNKSSFRFRVNFLIKDPMTQQLVSRIFEQGWDVYTQLKGLNDDYPLEKHFMKVKRTGSDKNNTKYTVTPVKDGAVTITQEKLMVGVALQDLVTPVPVEQKPAAGNPRAYTAAQIEECDNRFGPPHGEDDLPF